MIDLSNAYYQTTHATVCYVSQPENWVEISWKGHVSLDEVREVLAKVLSMLRAAKAKKVLSDHRLMSNSWDSVNRWVVEQWEPEARRKGLRYVAFVGPEELLPRISLDNLERMLHKKRPDMQKNIRIFKDIEEARTWLRNL